MTTQIALCKYRGMLVLFEVKTAKDGIGHFPDCGGTEFHDGESWDKGGQYAANVGFRH